MFHYKLARNHDPRVAGQALLAELSTWANACVRRYMDQPPIEGLDQAVYAAGWLPLIYFEPNHPAADLLEQIRDDVAENSIENGAWHHGYWRMADISMGMRHFEVFLGSLARLNSDMVTGGQILHAAEHIGNWCEDVPTWFDESRGCFHSHFFGTEGAEKDSCGFDTPEHFHCINLALIAFRLNQSRRYAEWAIRYGGRWADAILANSMLPVGLDEKGAVLEPNLGPDARENLYRAEAFLAADAVQSLLKLWNVSGEDRFRQAAEKIIETLLPELIDPDAGGLAAAIRFYRRITKSDRFDAKVMEEFGYLLPYTIDFIDLDTAPIYDECPLGLGKSADLPHWREDNQTRQHNPVLIALAAEISNDATLAARALDLGTAYLSLAQRAFPDGREDSDSARTVSAIARGHARDNNAGVVTEVLVPLMARFK
ncbi:MAG: hypothetical protein AAFX93_02815 [Verrucomicrobiota bacterium]